MGSHLHESADGRDQKPTRLRGSRLTSINEGPVAREKKKKHQYVEFFKCQVCPYFGNLFIYETPMGSDIGCESFLDEVFFLQGNACKAGVMCDPSVPGAVVSEVSCTNHFFNAILFKEC